MKSQKPGQWDKQALAAVNPKPHRLCTGLFDTFWRHGAEVLQPT